MVLYNNGVPPKAPASRRSMIALGYILCLSSSCHSGVVARQQSFVRPSSRQWRELDSLLQSNADCNYLSQLNLMRGGKEITSTNMSGKKKKKKKSSPSNIKKAKAAVNEVLHDTDAADALGEAIRNHADLLRNDDTKMINDSMKSLGWAMGASDHDMTGGIQVAPGSVLANYFLKSHGGAHGLQSICSALAAATGFAVFLVPKSRHAVRLALIKRCLIFAMVKHASGLLAGSFVAAQSIPMTGYRRAVEWMKDLANDPVSQYVFYTAIILLWLPSTVVKATSIPLDYWWKTRQIVPVILLAPILLREVLSTAFVVSDVLLLHATLAKQNDSSDNKLTKSLLVASSTTMNAVMSLLVTPSRWKSSSVAERQEIMAKLVSRLSIVFELATGLIIATDIALTTASGGLLRMAKQVLCLRLYLQFLWIRRTKIKRLAGEIRGGAGDVPFYLLGILMDPRGAMGFDGGDHSNQKGDHNKEEEWTWKEYAATVLDLQ